MNCSAVRLASEAQSISRNRRTGSAKLTPGENAEVIGLLEQAQAAKALEPYKTVVFDDGCDARELNSDESRLLEDVCARLGYAVEDVGG